MTKPKHTPETAAERDMLKEVVVELIAALENSNIEFAAILTSVFCNISPNNRDMIAARIFANKAALQKADKN